MTEQALFQLGIDLEAPSNAQTEGYISTTNGSVCAHRPEEPRDHFTVKNGTECAGTHLIIDLIGANGLDDIGLIEWTLRRCVKESGATLLHIHLHHFTPNHGVSGVVVLAESHISIHTWPERHYAALDVFMCGDAKPELCVEVLRRAFSPQTVRVKEILRGEGV
jgi:S-adenosylmethionine decarboxylase